MSVTINAKGTSVSSFMVGKNGAVIGQDGSITPPAGGNVTLNLDPDAGLILQAGTGPSLITSTDGLDLHINPATGGGQYLVLCDSRWPATSGTAGQVITTNGSGILSFTNVGTVTTASVATANGFAGTVSDASSTPTITLSTTVTGILKGNGTVISAATQSDFAPKYEEYVATSSQTVFTTTMVTIANTGGRSYLQVFVNGVYQQQGASKAYTVTDTNQITFNTGLAENANVVIYGFA